VLPAYYEYVFAAFAFILGASIGSFLNVCIYRMPLELSVNEPKRSFCPKCKYQIPFHHNIPLFSWLILRGKCANCGARISFRYFGVELLTALLFLAVWLRVWTYGREGLAHQGWALALPYWIMVSLFVVATFIDFEHFLIPDEITVWGAAAGVVLSFAVPALQDQTSNLVSGLWSLAGAAIGYATLWVVVELGKIAFGKKHFAPRSIMPFTWRRRVVTTPQGDVSDADLVVGDIGWKEQPKPSFIAGVAETFRSLLESFRLLKPKAQERGESWEWSETMSYRESDRLIMKCPKASIDGEEFQDVELVFSLNQLKIGDRTWELEKVDLIEGEVASVIIPREAMGFGDVKFIACIGAFLGWKGVAFTIMSASSIGAVIGLLTIGIGKREWSAKIPFGPYLALGALIWLFIGPELVNWYWAMTFPPAP